MNINIPIVIGQLISVIQQNLTTPGTSQLVTSLAGVSRSINGPTWKLISMFILQGFLTFCDIALVSQLGERVAKRLRQGLFQNLVHREIAFFDANMQGEIIGRLSQDVAEFKVDLSFF